MTAGTDLVLPSTTKKGVVNDKSLLWGNLTEKTLNTLLASAAASCHPANLLPTALLQGGVMKIKELQGVL